MESFLKKYSKTLVQKDVCLTEANVQEAIDELRGACTIVYPMGLPPHDPIQMEFENKEDLEGTQVIHCLEDMYEDTSITESVLKFELQYHSRLRWKLFPIKMHLFGLAGRRWSKARSSWIIWAKTKSPKLSLKFKKFVFFCKNNLAISNLKLIVCLNLKRGSGAPAREPVVSEEEQKKMMAYYFKKNEEMKVGFISCYFFLELILILCV
jgi:hypothetical protein